MNLIPNAGLILVVPEKTVKNSKGGLFLPDSVANNTLKARVVAAGTGEYLANGAYVGAKYSVGDEVLYPATHGTKIEFDGEEYTVLRQGDVLLSFGGLNGSSGIDTIPEQESEVGPSVKAF